MFMNESEPGSVPSLATPRKHASAISPPSFIDLRHGRVWAQNQPFMPAQEAREHGHIKKKEKKERKKKRKRQIPDEISEV